MSRIIIPEAVSPLLDWSASLSSGDIARKRRSLGGDTVWRSTLLRVCQMGRTLTDSDLLLFNFLVVQVRRT